MTTATEATCRHTASLCRRPKKVYINDSVELSKNEQSEEGQGG